MSRTHLTQCDIECCINTPRQIAKKMQVLFITYNDPIAPYFKIVTINICDDCLNKMHSSGKYITANKVQGHVIYEL